MQGAPWGRLLIRPVLIVLAIGFIIGAGLMAAAKMLPQPPIASASLEQFVGKIDVEKRHGRTGEIRLYRYDVASFDDAEVAKGRFELRDGTMYLVGSTESVSDFIAKWVALPSGGYSFMAKYSGSGEICDYKIWKEGVS